MFKYLLKKISVVLFIGVNLCYGKIAVGETFDARVSKNREETISGAIKNGAKQIFIDVGIYDEQVELPGGVQLLGEDIDRTILSGGIIMHDDAAISGITVSGLGVIIAPDSDAFIDNVKVADVVGNGIETNGLGYLTIKKTKILNSEKKGVYVRWGGRIEVVDSQIIGNKEEGIDMRGFVIGYIKNNTINDNGESGIEEVIGDSNLIISGNEIRRNNGSGVDLQFYEISRNKGRVYLFENNLSENGDYGLNCDMPSGGSADDEYWKDSIYLSVGNVVVNNRKNEINKRCSVNNEERADMKFQVDKYENESKKNRLNKVERSAYREELENDVNARQIKLSENALKYKKEVGDMERNIKGRSRIIAFLFGIDDSTLEKMRNLRGESQLIINESLDLMQRTVDNEKISKLNGIYAETLNLQISQNNSINYYKKLGLLNKLKLHEK